MHNKKFYLLRLILLSSDMLILNLTYGILYLVFTDEINKEHTYTNLIALATFNILWMIASLVFELYSYKTIVEIEKIYRRTWHTFTIQALLFSGIYLFFHNQHFSFRLLCFCLGCTAALLVLNRFFLTYITEFVFKKFVTKRKVIVVGYNEVGKQLVDFFNNNNHFYSLAGFFDNHEDASANMLYKGKIEECVNYAVQHQITDAYSTILPEEDNQTIDLKNMAENKGIRLLFVAGKQQAQSTTTTTYHRVDYIEKMPVMTLHSEPLLRLRNSLRKRVFDIIFSTIAIVFIMSWLTPLIAIIIKLSSPGPVFFVQQRSGKDNQPFWCFKFRSMTVNESSDEKQATKGDSRITPIGAFMRKTSIDELPQFFNVFLGNMSIVGPRPHMLKHTEQYSAIIDKYLVRHYLKPGITGWAQVNGYRGETADISLMEKRVEHDIEYMENWSLMLDVKIIFMTIINVFRGEENAW